MKECKTCKRIGMGLARFGGGTVFLLVGATLLAGGLPAWEVLGTQICDWYPAVIGGIAAVIFAITGVSMLFGGCFWKPTLGASGVVFAVAAIAMLINGAAMVTTLAGGVWVLILLACLCFGLAVNAPKKCGSSCNGGSCSTKHETDHAGCCGGGCSDHEKFKEME